MRDRGARRAGPLAVTAAIVAAGVGLVVVIVVIAFLMLHTTGSPQETATAYLTGWQTSTYASMDAVSVNKPRGGLAARCARLRRSSACVTSASCSGG